MPRYDGGASGSLVGEYDGSGNLVQETVWLGDIPVATLRPNGSSVAIYYVVTDHLDTPREVVRPSDNALLWSWFTGPFGVEAPNTNPQGAGTFTYDLRFPGQIAGAWGNTFQNDWRDLDPAIGRYQESDPIGLRGGSFSTYAYANGNPISVRDALGLAGGEEDEEEETPGYANPIVELQYQTLISQIREYAPSFEDEGYRPQNDPINESDIARLQQELNDLKYDDVCPRPGTSSEIRRKPGSRGLLKGTDALRAENSMARDAATAAGLSQDQAQQLHEEISGENLTYAEILELAMSIKNGK